MLSALALAALIQSAPVSEDIFILSEPAPLHGTLLTPAETHAAAVLIPGSGPTDRDGNQMPAVQAATLRLLAEALAEDGIATVRIDKRGVGASAMAARSEDALRFDHMAEDARAWAADLAQRTGQDCVWLMGHSEGGLVAQVAAADNPQVCGVVLLASAGRPAADVVREQLAALPNAERLDLEGVNHVLKNAPDDRIGNIAVYADPDAPLAEGLADGVAAFILGN